MKHKQNSFHVYEIHHSEEAEGEEQNNASLVEEEKNKSDVTRKREMGRRGGVISAGCPFGR